MKKSHADSEIRKIFIFQTRKWRNNCIWLNLQVSRLILLSGANPNMITETLNNAPALCVAAQQGFSDMVSLLLEFGADVSGSGDDGIMPLCHAARQGHIEVIRLLMKRRAQVGTLKESRKSKDNIQTEHKRNTRNEICKILLKMPL